MFKKRQKKQKANFNVEQDEQNKQILQKKQDDDEKVIDQGPKKYIKTQNSNIKAKAVISNSTLQHKQQLQEAVHNEFNEINHKAGRNLIKDMNLPADELEQQLAKKRFLQNVQATKLAKDGKISNKIYRGINNYTNHQMTENEIQNAQEAYKKKMGPSRLNSTIKNSCRFDYVLNLCKDWHDSGYCPFGNSCLYLHDRSNYKTGWEMQKQFQQSQRERWKRINNPQLAKKEDRQKLLKGIQKYKPASQCSNCLKQFIQPVEVQCGHIFCTKCAIKLIKCRQCGKRLSGIMNNAKEKLLKQKNDYDEMLNKLQNSEEEVHRKRRKFQNMDALDVFAD